MKAADLGEQETLFQAKSGPKEGANEMFLLVLYVKSALCNLQIQVYTDSQFCFVFSLFTLLYTQSRLYLATN